MSQDPSLSEIQIGHITSQWAQSSKLPHQYLKSTESTNDLAKAEAFGKDGEESLKVYLTDEQTAGRGRGKNSWLNAEPGSALLSSWSFMLQDPPHPTLTAKLGLGLIRALSSTWPYLTWNLKAPNDIYLNDRKVAGLLTETISQGDDHRLIIGLGLNVWSHPEKVELATHLSMELPEDAPLIGEDWIGFLDRWIFEMSDAVGRGFDELNTSDCEALTFYMNQYSSRERVERVKSDGSIVTSTKTTNWMEL